MAGPPIPPVVLAPGKSGLLLVSAYLRRPSNYVWEEHLTTAVALQIAVSERRTGLSIRVSAALQVPDCGHPLRAGEV